MAYKLVTPRIGAQPFAETSTTKLHPLGQCLMGVDPDMGEGEFIYVIASNSVAQYDAVAIKAGYKIAPLTITNGKTCGEVGFAQIANGTKDTYMWVQKNGTPVVKLAIACQANVPLYATATGGVLDDASTSVQLQGMTALTEATHSANAKTCLARYVTTQVEPAA